MSEGRCVGGGERAAVTRVLAMRSAAASMPTASSAPRGAAQAAASSHIAAMERMCTPICLTWGCLGGSHASTLGAKPLALMFSILTLYSIGRVTLYPPDVQQQIS